MSNSLNLADNKSSSKQNTTIVFKNDEDVQTPQSDITTPNDDQSHTSNLKLCVTTPKEDVLVDLVALADTINKKVIKTRETEHSRVTQDITTYNPNIELDIYEVCAIYAKLHERAATPKSKKSTQKRYYYCVAKCLLCAVCQLMGLAMILINAGQEIYDNGWCRLGDNYNKKILTTGLQIYLLFYQESAFQLSEQSGLRPYMTSYLYNKCHIKEINTSTIPHSLYKVPIATLGFHINNVVFMMTSLGSAALIYSNFEAVELILNFVGLFFVAEMDNNMVTHEDRTYLKKTFTVKIKPKFHKKEFNKCFVFLNTIYVDIQVTIAFCLSLFLTYIVPIWNFACY